jgi:rhodanese-related sulfurtransferase
MSRSKPSRRPLKRQPRFMGRQGLFFGLGVVALLAFAGLLFLQGSPNAGQALAEEVSVDQALSMREAGAFVLDVRQPEEWLDHHIPGSTLIPLGELPARLAQVPQDQEILVVCRSGNRSAEGRDVLLRAGYERVTSMAGGLTQWRAAGYPTVSGP